MYICKVDGTDREVKLYLIQQDITKLKVDAIVNAAHEGLVGGGGVDGAIHRAAGPKLTQECQTIPEVSRGCRCPVGEAHITGGYRLPCKYVIHTVAPKFSGSVSKLPSDKMNELSIWSLTKNIYKDATEGTDEDLYRCYENCLKLAGKNSDIETIAFPSLGTGGHAIPIEIASTIAIKAVIENLKEASSIKEVYFVVFSDFDRKFYEEAFKYA